MSIVQIMVNFILLGFYSTDFEDLTIKPENEKVYIEWKSTIKTNNQYFEIQRTSTNSFKTIAVILTIEDLEIKKAFNYTDEVQNNASPIVKYRIKKVNLNNNITYSPIVECNINKD